MYSPAVEPDFQVRRWDAMLGEDLHLYADNDTAAEEVLDEKGSAALLVNACISKRLRICTYPSIQNSALGFPDPTIRALEKEGDVECHR